MRWGTEPSTPLAKRSKSKQLSSDYANDYGTHIERSGLPLEPVQKSNRKPARKCGRNVAHLRAGPFAVSERIPGGTAAHPARQRNAHDIAGRDRWAQGTRKYVYPIRCMQNIKAAHNAVNGHCERRCIFCGYSRDGAGIPTARGNGRRRCERVPGVHPDGHEVQRSVGWLLGRSGASYRDQA